MDHKGEPQEDVMGLKHEELPQMDGSCDACEPDEAQPATQVCHTCSFAFCRVHADAHASSTHHPIQPYNHAETQANGPGNDRVSRVGDGAEDEARADGAAGIATNRERPPPNGDERDGAGGRQGARSGLHPEAEPGDGAEGAEAEQEAVAAGEAGKSDTVTVERLRCKEHAQEGSLYCKADEKIICVVCAVQGEHREHEIITLHEAYVWQKSRQGYDLLACTQQMSEKIKSKWTNPEMSTEELEAYVNSQFDELRKLVRLEEKRTLHLVDLKEAFPEGVRCGENRGDLPPDRAPTGGDGRDHAPAVPAGTGGGDRSRDGSRGPRTNPLPAHRVPATRAEVRPREPTRL